MQLKLIITKLKFGLGAFYDTKPGNGLYIFFQPWEQSTLALLQILKDMPLYLVVYTGTTGNANGEHYEPVEPIDRSNIAEQNVEILFSNLALGFR